MDDALLMCCRQALRNLGAKPHGFALGQWPPSGLSFIETPTINSVTRKSVSAWVSKSWTNGDIRVIQRR